MPSVCTVDGCSKRHECHGYCPMHWQRVKKYGSPDLLAMPWDPDVRFARDHVVNPETGCWDWQGKDRNQEGHARWFVGGKRIGVHRWAYERFVGPIPEGLVLDHVVCQNPGCVNPAHLEPVTQPVNVMRAPTAITTINAKKTHCIHGHEFTPENTRIGVNTGGRPRRYCKACQGAVVAAARAKKVA